MCKIFARALLFLTVVLSSCEGYKGIYGIVRDKKTDIPLDGVLVEVVNKENDEGVNTDSNGYFETTGPFGGCMPDCPDIIVRLSKPNYDTLEIKNPKDTVFYLTTKK